MQFFFLFLFFFFASVLCPSPQAEENITDVTPMVINEPVANSYPPGETAFILYDPSRKKVLDQLNEDALLVPSSTLKILTGLAALKILGNDFRFTTKLILNKQNQLILIGGGDPLLTVTHLQKILRKALASPLLKKKKITHFFYDASLFPEQELIDLGQNDNFNYNSGVSPLSINFNQFRLRWAEASSSSSSGSIVTHESPLADFHQIQLSKHTIGFNNELIAVNESRTWGLSAHNKMNGQINLPIRQPAAYAATLFARLAQQEGWQLPPPIPLSSPASTKGQILASHESRSLAEIVELMFEYSNNLVAENLLMTCAKKISPSQKTAKTKIKIKNLASAASILQQWWKKQIPHVFKKHPNSLVMVNGSGLSAKNQISVATLLAILAWAPASSLDLLPISGAKGSLSNRLTTPLTTLRVWAKTGSQNFSTALAGKIYTEGRRTLLFVAINNHRQWRNKLDLHPAEMTAEKEQIVPWAEKARAYQDNLISRWIAHY